MKVLVVTADRALRASLSYLLRMEPDLEVWDCSPRDADGLLMRIDPDVVLTSGPFRPEDRRIGALAGLAPFDSLSRELQEANGTWRENTGR